MSSSVLLLGADYYGTLAAVRAYGRAGIRVTVADENSHARALFSRYATSKAIHPPLSRPNELVDWLVEYGSQHPGTLLYAPSDALCWLFAAERERLSKAFVMLCPNESTILTLLDKGRLHEACRAVGIEVPETQVLDATGVGGLEASKLRYPILLKPRTQVFLESGVKGILVSSEAELRAELVRYGELIRFHSVLSERHPEILQPMVQQYLPEAETRIFSISGFVDKSGTIVARAAMKVLQRPRKLGIGLCFESRELEPPLVEKLAALCKHVGYFGAFESEFIVVDERRLMIDFNPRYYSQMAFDIARGVSLPMMVWHAARGDAIQLATEVDRARSWRGIGREVYCHKKMFDLVLFLQGISGQMSKEDLRKWRAWYANHRDVATDALHDPEDRLPSLIDTASWVRVFARHPRAFVRGFVMNR